MAKGHRAPGADTGTVSTVGRISDRNHDRSGVPDPKGLRGKPKKVKLTRSSSDAQKAPEVITPARRQKKLDVTAPPKTPVRSKTPPVTASQPKTPPVVAPQTKASTKKTTIIPVPAVVPPVAKNPTPNGPARSSKESSKQKNAGEFDDISELEEEERDDEDDDEESEGLFDVAGDLDVEKVMVKPVSSRSAATLSALSAFQRSADRFPPLNNEQQLELTRVYREGQAARLALETTKMKAKERAVAMESIRQAERAMEHLCASCWRLAWLLVREQAEKRFGRDKAAEMLPDLMAEANSALVKSVTDFDPKQTPKFHTYAARVIRDHLRAVLARDGYMRLAPSWVRVKRMAVTLVPELTLKLNRHPSHEELQEALLARCLDWADAHLTDAQRALPETRRHEARMAKLRKQGMLGAVRDIEEVLIASQAVSSLDAPVGEEGGSATLGDLLPGAADTTAYDRVEHAELQQALAAALNTLSEREKEILLLRHGFDGGEAWTYGKIAERHNVTSERIRQIEKSALAKLSSPHAQFAGLASFLPSQGEA